MNNIIIKANNKEEYNKTLDILGGLGVIWNNGQTIDSKNDVANSYDIISMMSELIGVLEEKEDIKEDEPVVCLIVEHNKLFWELLDNMIENCFDAKDYEMYTFEDFEKVYNL
ncbi:MAG: hypothetical protein ACI3T9_02860 [Romboutsia timonensis]